MKLIALILVCTAGLMACCSRSSSNAAGDDGTVVIAGTVLDAASGEPVAEAEVRGPRDTRAESDERGRFELEGLEPGDEGPLEARCDDGRRGSVTLRPQRGGRTEVLILVASQEKDG